MEKNVSSVKILNIIVCFIILITFAVIGTKVNVHADGVNSSNDEVLPSIRQLGYKYQDLLQNYNFTFYNPKEEIITYDLDYYINQNKETIKFFAKIFDYKLENVIYDLKQREKDNDEFISTNIGYLKDKNGNLYVYDNFEYGLIEYFYDLNENHKDLRHVNYEPYTGSSDYVEKLIMYYTSIYTNVDRTTLLSIGAAESGYYKVKFMLKYNNIYGGMSSHGLIKHNNIEIGVLSYVRMMSRNYYGKGLDNPQSIGRVYCPRMVDGKKIASPHWIDLVNTAKNKYKNYTDEITLDNITNNTVIL